MVTSRLDAATDNSPAGRDDQDDGDKRVVPWLTVSDVDTARRELANLIDWLQAVYLHYDDAMLPDCWLWHPGVVAELMALRGAWVAAHRGQSASPQRVMDWHDGYRPRTVRRIADLLTGCSLDQHAPGGEREYRPLRAPGVDMADVLTEWWTRTHGRSAAPSPTPALLAEARARRAGKGW